MNNLIKKWKKYLFKKNESSLIKSKIKRSASHKHHPERNGGVCYLCGVKETPMVCVYRNKQEMNVDSLSRFIICFFQQTIVTFNVMYRVVFFFICEILKWNMCSVGMLVLVGSNSHTIPMCYEYVLHHK